MPITVSVTHYAAGHINDSGDRTYTRLNSSRSQQWTMKCMSIFTVTNLFHFTWCKHAEKFLPNFLALLSDKKQYMW